jgi:hypothetical protein
MWVSEREWENESERERERVRERESRRRKKVSWNEPRGLFQLHICWLKRGRKKRKKEEGWRKEGKKERLTDIFQKFVFNNLMKSLFVSLHPWKGKKVSQQLNSIYTSLVINTIMGLLGETFKWGMNFRSNFTWTSPKHFIEGIIVAFSKLK